MTRREERLERDHRGWLKIQKTVPVVVYVGRSLAPKKDTKKCHANILKRERNLERERESTKAM